MNDFILAIMMFLILSFIYDEINKNNPCHRLAAHHEQCNSDNSPERL
jgi:hypothetical protein